MWYYAYCFVSYFFFSFIFLFLHLILKMLTKPSVIIARAAFRCTSWCISSYLSVLLLLVSKLLAEPPAPVGARSWDTDILPDVLQEISDCLPLRDFVAFRSVCRRWRSAPSGRSAIANFPRNEVRLWLVFYGHDTDDTAHYVYAHPHQNSCTLRLPQLRNANVKQSKSGWLFAHRRQHFFLFNPFTLVKINLPDHDVREDQACTMTKSTVFIVSHIDDSTLEISWCRVGDAEWNSHTAEVDKGRLGNLSEIYVCDCVHIYICGSKNSLMYDYVKRNYVYCQLEERTSLAWRTYFQNPTYHKDWLERFGAKGISVFCCSTGIRIMRADGDGCIGTRAFNFIVTEEESVAELKSVKAFLIEPSFG